MANEFQPLRPILDITHSDSSQNYMDEVMYQANYCYLGFIMSQLPYRGNGKSIPTKELCLLSDAHFYGTNRNTHCRDFLLDSWKSSVFLIYTEIFTIITTVLEAKVLTMIQPLSSENLSWGGLTLNSHLVCNFPIYLFHRTQKSYKGEFNDSDLWDCVKN